MKLKSITYTLLFFKLLIIFNPNIMYAQHRHTPEKSNIPFFKKLILLFDSKQHQNKRYLKQYEKTGNILRLEQYIGSPEMQQRQHAINPFTYYIVKGIVAENKEKGCPKEAFWFYSAALEIDEKELRTKNDIDIISKLLKLDKKYNQLGIEQAGNYSIWLRQKHNEFYGCHSSQLVPKTETIDSLLMRVTQKEDSIKKEKLAIDSLKIAVSKLENEKAAIVKEQSQFNEKIRALKSKQDYQRFRLEVKKIEELKQQDFQEMQALMNNQLAIPIKTALYTDANAKFIFKQKDSDTGIVFKAKGQASGKHCTEDVQNATQEILDILLTEIKQHKSIIRQNLSVDLKIAGHADWHGAGKKIKISYEASEDIEETYLNRDGEERLFKIQAGETRNIENEQLAFLRAYCAYQTAQIVLEKNQLSINQLTLKGIEHFEPNDYNNIDESNFRGIELSITINNLFQQYENLIKQEEHKLGGSLRAIKKIEKQIDNTKRAIRNKERWIEQQQKKIEKIWKKIDEQEKQISDIKFIMENAKSNTYINSEVTKIIASVKEDRTHWQTLTKKEQRAY